MNVIYYFTADWCQPCKKVRPIVNELNHDQTEASFQIIDIDDNHDLVKRFEIKAVPTFIFFEDGVEKRRTAGAKTREQLEDFIYGR